MEVYYINLDRAVKRRSLCESGLLKKGVPPEKIHRIRAYSDDIGVTDGHELRAAFLEKSGLRLPGSQTFGLLGSVTSQFCVLDRIVKEDDGLALILEDDMCLLRSYAELCEFADRLKGDIISFNYWRADRYDEYLRFQSNKDPDKKVDDISGADVYNGFACGGSRANIVSPKGANQILEVWDKHGKADQVKFALWQLSIGGMDPHHFSVGLSPLSFVVGIKESKLEERSVWADQMARY